MSQNSYFTQTSNFISANQGEVDPRTGLFSLSMLIAKLVGNNNLGPTLSLTINYSPLISDNPQGIGIGCGLGLSYYNYINRQLNLNTGERYKILENANNTVTVDQKRIDNFKFIKINKSEYHLIYKTGEIQVLTGGDGTSFLPTKIYCPAGHIMFLSWAVNSVQKRLVAIWDESTTQTNPLCKVIYNDSSGSSTFIIWPGSSEEVYQVILATKSGGLLSQISNTAVSPNLIWRLSYTKIADFNLLTEVIAPTGYKQSVTYASNVISFPSAAKIQVGLPAVIKYIQNPGFGQPAIVTIFDYKLYGFNNYLGFGNNTITSWLASQDALLNSKYYDLKTGNGYFYGSTETVIDASNNKVLLTTKRTYNSLHLMVIQAKTQGTCTVQADITFPLTNGANIDGQAPQYALPTVQKVTYTDTSKPASGRTRSEATISAYDNSGNILSQVLPDGPTGNIPSADGTLTQYSYYPASSGDSNCPKEPNGFTSFVKTKTVTPVLMKYGDVSYKTPTQVITYMYSQAVLPRGYPAPYVIFQKQVVDAYNNKIHTSQLVTHNTQPGSPEFGRVTQIQLTTPGEKGVSYVTTVNFTSAISGDNLKQTTVFTGYDGLSFQVLREQSRYSGRVKNTTDRQGNQQNYTYDKLGRLRSHILNKGTPYENTHTTTYTLNFASPANISTQRNDNCGNIQTLYFDGIGRLLKNSRNQPSAVNATGEYIYASNNYDNQGRLSNCTTHDVLEIATGDGGKLTDVALAVTCYYNNWGMVSQTCFSDQHVEYTNYDPISRQAIAQLQTTASVSTAKSSTIQGGLTNAVSTLGFQRITVNTQQLPVKIEHVDANNVTIGVKTNVYDGLKRLRKHIDEQGYTTQYTYDDWGRVITQTLPDNTVVTKSYDLSSSKALVTGITVTPQGKATINMGTQLFDSLHRLVRTTSGGRTYLYCYKDPHPFMSSVASTVKTPAGQTVKYQYIPQLENALSKVSDDNGFSQSRSYDGLTGELTGAKDSSSGNMTRQMHYVPAGYLAQEDFSLAGANPRSAVYTHSVMGNPHTYKDIAGATQTCRYDSTGRPCQLDDPAVSIVLKYDVYGRMSTQTATDKATGGSVSTALSYDDFGREVVRIITSSTVGEMLKQSNQYNKNGQCAVRITEKGNELLRQENYSYDTRSRLENYQCRGSTPPQDSYGNSVLKQSFSYDVLSNITQCVTSFTHTGTPGTDTAVFSYSNSHDPTQLVSVTHTHSSYPGKITLSYDANGRMIKDEAGRTLNYDVLGRLQSVSGPQIAGGKYGYDGLNNLVSQTVTGKGQWELYYRANKLVNEIECDKNQESRYVKVANHCVGVSVNAVK